MDDLLEMKKLSPGSPCPVMAVKIPKLIQKEIDGWVKESKKFKNSPLAELKAHENVGYLAMDGKPHNSYQCSISPHLIESSFWLAWTLRIAAKYWGGGKSHRDFKLRKWDGHFDGYDIWTNFAYKNHGHPTHFDEYECGYKGLDGTMVMFPSQVLHHVEPQTVSKERITLAFNITEKNA